MLKQLLIYLQHDELEQASWAFADENAQIQATAFNQPLSQLPTPSPELTITVVVPAQDVLLLQVKLPPISRARLKQAVPYALEEHLIEEVSQLHFTIGEKLPNGLWPIAIVRKSKIEQWLALLQRYQIFPTILLPLTLMVPYAKNQWHITLTDTVATVRQETTTGFACDSSNLATLLQISLANTKTQPSQIYLHNYTDSQPSLALNLPLTIHSIHTEQLITDMVNWSAACAPLNLLQGPYRAKYPRLTSNKIGRLGAGLLAGCLALILLMQVSSLLFLRAQHHTLQATIANIYYSHFPQSSRLIAPQQRMEEEWHQLAKKQQQNSLSVWLNYIGQSLAEVNDVRIQRLDFQNQQLSLNIIATSYAILNRFMQALMQQHLKVTLTHSAIQNNQVKASLLIMGDTL